MTNNNDYINQIFEEEGFLEALSQCKKTIKGILIMPKAKTKFLQSLKINDQNIQACEVLKILCSLNYYEQSENHQIEEVGKTLSEVPLNASSVIPKVNEEVLEINMKGLKDCIDTLAELEPKKLVAPTVLIRKQIEQDITSCKKDIKKYILEIKKLEGKIKTWQISKKNDT